MSYFNIGSKFLWAWNTELSVHLILIVAYGAGSLPGTPSVRRLQYITEAPHTNIERNTRPQLHPTISG